MMPEAAMKPMDIVAERILRCMQLLNAVVCVMSSTILWLALQGSVDAQFRNAFIAPLISCIGIIFSLSTSKLNLLRLSVSCQIQVNVYTWIFFGIVNVADILQNSDTAGIFDVSQTICITPTIVSLGTIVTIILDPSIKRLAAFPLYLGLMSTYRHVRPDLFPLASVMTILGIMTAGLLFSLMSAISQITSELQMSNTKLQHACAELEAQAELLKDANARLSQAYSELAEKMQNEVKMAKERAIARERTQLLESLYDATMCISMDKPGLVVESSSAGDQLFCCKMEGLYLQDAAIAGETDKLAVFFRNVHEEITRSMDKAVPAAEGTSSESESSSDSASTSNPSIIRSLVTFQDSFKSQFDCELRAMVQKKHEKTLELCVGIRIFGEKRNLRSDQLLTSENPSLTPSSSFEAPDASQFEVISNPSSVGSEEPGNVLGEAFLDTNGNLRNCTQGWADVFHQANEGSAHGNLVPGARVRLARTIDQTLFDVTLLTSAYEGLAGLTHRLFLQGPVSERGAVQRALGGLLSKGIKPSSSCSGSSSGSCRSKSPKGSKSSSRRSSKLGPSANPEETLPLDSVPE